METWYLLEITDGDEAKTMMQRIMDAFMPKYIGAGRPLDMAVFSSHNAVSNTWTLYFSPKAMSLAMRFGANRFESNFVDQDLALLVGDARSIDILFPDAKAG
tara:strand:+ start:1658 stop:1963 length:306 start_codon:yes stop_codon:yes gene_type:complete